jgi:hypothetical protein
MNVAQAAEAVTTITTPDGFVIRPDWLYKGRAKLSADGIQLPPDSTDHAQVYDPLNGLIESIGAPGFKKVTPDEAIDLASKLTFAGHLGWLIPDYHEVNHPVDPTQHGPAVDLSLYPDAVADWYWSSTQTSWTEGKTGSSRSFFYVGVGYGVVSSYGAFNLLRARPVRRAAPASQCLVIGQ